MYITVICMWCGKIFLQRVLQDYRTYRWYCSTVLQIFRHEPVRGTEIFGVYRIPDGGCKKLVSQSVFTHNNNAQSSLPHTENHFFRDTERATIVIPLRFFNRVTLPSLAGGWLCCVVSVPMCPSGVAISLLLLVCGCFFTRGVHFAVRDCCAAAVTSTLVSICNATSRACKP